MFRVYIYYLKGQNKKDFNDSKKAIDYAKKILAKGKVMHIVVEDILNYNIIYDKFAN